MISPRHAFHAGRLLKTAGFTPLLVLLASAATLAAPQAGPKKAGHVTVRALADRQAVVPGELVNLAVSLETDKGWYVYWQNPGTIGLPTKIQWAAPPGYQIGRVRFPVPQLKFDKTLEATNYIHEGTSLFLTAVTVPDSAVPGSEAKFALDASWLVCKKSCVPGSAKLALTLPVVAPGSETRPANTKTFEQARRALPMPADASKHAKLSGSISAEAVKPGGAFTATLTAEIEAKHHMQSNKPLVEGLIPAILFVERTAGLEIGEVLYPKPHVRTDKMLGKMSEYGGRVHFKIPVTVDEDADKAPRWIRGILQNQICTDAGTCFRPQHIAFAIPVRLAGGPAPTGARAMLPIEAAGDGPPDATVPSDEHQEAQAATAEDAPRQKQPAIASESLLIRIQDWLFSFDYAGVILAGLLGGLVLNLMPCVLPVISLKVLSFVRQAHEDRWRIFRMGLVYSAGIMVFFIFLAVIFYVWGTGWGELFQNPVFVIIMAAIVLAFSLSLFGVFALFTPKIVNELGQKAEAQEGYLSAFGTGVLATLLGTACTAPFLSAAIGYAARLPPLQGTTIFLAVGVGMASPIVVLSYNPAWLRFVPKPGAWMGVFEAIMGFILMGTVIWLLNPLRDQIGAFGMLLTLIFLLAVSVAVWIKGKIEFGASATRKIKLYATAAIVVMIGWYFPFRMISSIPELTDEQIEHEDLLARGMRAKYGKDLDWSRGIPWQPFVRDLAMQDVRDGYTVFVDYTASWCASCKTNLAVFIEQPEVVQVMRELDVMPYEADYSLYNPEIKKDLDRFGRAGVPMYLVYSPGDTENPEVLPEVPLVPTIVAALRQAGPSQVPAAAAD